MVTILDRVNKPIKAKADAEKPFRDHLGGSMIGKICERELFYNFRWAIRPNFDARMLRLFDRGHKEEFRFVEYLRNAGVFVKDYSQRLCYHDESDAYVLLDWDAEVCELLDVSDSQTHIERATLRGAGPKQWRISDILEHFGGSLDGISIADFDVEDAKGRKIPLNTEFLNEFKTHNFKSFIKLINDGVKEAKPVHWAQMQIYMYKRQLNFALYTAVNKNDDDLYFEIVYYEPTEGPLLLAKAERVITARIAPVRIGKHPSWHDCKFCEYKEPCHMGGAVERHCRSCRFASAVAEGRWHCGHWNMLIPGDAIMAGCDNYAPIHD